jgi:proline iminopeptidase
MRIEVNGIRLYFDVEGASLTPDGPRMREKPTLLLLHGGPGFDHSVYKPAFSQFTDIAQVIYLDHRGNGRSDAGTPDTWNLAQWGDDVFAFCEALQIERPVVMGNSFGGFVAMSYATRHPEHPGKLILSCTYARPRFDRQHAVFERLGGPEARAASERFEHEGATPEVLAEFARCCMPHYHRKPPADPDAPKRGITNLATMQWFDRAGGEGRTFDMMPDLARIACPTLVLGGEEDPAAPIEDQADIAAALPPHLVRFQRFAHAGHSVYRDDPRAYDAIRNFINE